MKVSPSYVLIPHICFYFPQISTFLPLLTDSIEIIALKNVVTPTKTQNKLYYVDQDLVKTNTINENFALGMCTFWFLRFLLFEREEQFGS